MVSVACRQFTGAGPRADFPALARLPSRCRAAHRGRLVTAVILRLWPRQAIRFDGYRAGRGGDMTSPPPLTLYSTPEPSPTIKVRVRKNGRLWKKRTKKAIATVEGVAEAEAKPRLVRPQAAGFPLSASPRPSAVRPSVGPVPSSAPGEMEENDLSVQPSTPYKGRVVPALVPVTGG